MSTQTEMTTPEWEPQDEIESLRRQLAASQAREAQLREVVDRIGITSLDARQIADDTLALPQDTTALEAMVAEAGEVMRVRAVGVCLESNYDLHGRVPSIRALPGVTLEGLQ